MIKQIISSLIHPKELRALASVKISGSAEMSEESLEQIAYKLHDRAFCYAALSKVSRSFATVIKQLPVELQDPVCLFYLVLRGLDSIEDDMSLPKHEKLELLRNFHNLFQDVNWNIKNVGDTDDYRYLMARFDNVARFFQTIKPAHQKVIIDICRQMADGMAEFSEKEVVTINDFDLYCHYVAGLVGIGLSELFAHSGLESSELSAQRKISNSMGLFLQKTNIIRDYLEDYQSGRIFWPREIWSQYADDLGYFAKNPNNQKSLDCLNHMVADALRHLRDVMGYLNQINNQSIFRFCAIPQAMAIATLSNVYNNADVFKKVVKIRKGIAARLMVETNSMKEFNEFLLDFLSEIENNTLPNNPSFELINRRINEVKQLLRVEMKSTHKDGIAENIKHKVLHTADFLQLF